MFYKSVLPWVLQCKALHKQITWKEFCYFSTISCCGYSLKMPRRGIFNEFPQHMFIGEIRKQINTVWFKKLLIWSYFYQLSYHILLRHLHYDDNCVYPSLYFHSYLYRVHFLYSSNRPEELDLILVQNALVHKLLQVCKS